MRISKRKIFLSIASCLAFLTLHLGCGLAATVREVSLEEMLAHCQLVFEGQAIAIEAKENEQKRIHTYVTFAIQEVIKGTYPHATITLSFLGGTVGETTMAVSDMRFPQAGEHGIYFVESVERAQVHPLYGWSQGHFLVKTDANGASRVLTSGDKPVTETMLAPPASPTTSGTGTIKAMRRELTTQEAKALSADEFKRALREKMGRGQ